MKAVVPVLSPEPPPFHPPWWCRSSHVQTLWPSLIRRVPAPAWNRERLELDDGDFLDLDWCGSGGRPLLVISHGLEGSSRRVYVAGLARAALRRGWDVLAWNFRGCSGEPNRLPRSYHSGATEDLAAVVRHAARRSPAALALAGFSLGGNLTLKFLGEGNPEAERVRAGVAVSVPSDLAAAARRMAQPDCAFYMRRFLREMGPKMEAKRRRFGDRVPAVDWRSMRTFREFDNAYTAPLHGFRDAEEYWDRCSAIRYLPNLRCPALILNALDDPFLTPECSPLPAVHPQGRLSVVTPPSGGHVGFVGPGAFPGEYWGERVALEFLGRALD